MAWQGIAEKFCKCASALISMGMASEEVIEVLGDERVRGGKTRGEAVRWRSAAGGGKLRNLEAILGEGWCCSTGGRNGDDYGMLLRDEAF